MERTTQRRAVIACLVGYAFEGLDFIVFGMLSFVLSRLYFPSDNEVASLMLTLATFGVGYVIRPLGGIFWGIYADRHGRKAALVALSVLMAVATAIIAITPGFASIGIWAPVIIVILAPAPTTQRGPATVAIAVIAGESATVVTLPSSVATCHALLQD